MELKHKFENVSGNISMDELEIVSVSKDKYATVDLCIKSNMNIPFAMIKLYSRDRYVDAEACFESAKALGKEIERRWQLQAELGTINEKLMDALDEQGRLFEENEKYRWIPVTERLPEQKGYINVADVKTRVKQTWYWSNTNDEARRLEAFCTHWMPIPELPKD